MTEIEGNTLPSRYGFYSRYIVLYPLLHCLIVVQWYQLVPISTITIVYMCVVLDYIYTLYLSG